MSSDPFETALSGQIERGAAEHYLYLDGLHGNTVTDDNLSRIAEVVQQYGIKELSLSGTQITDEGLRHLSGLTNPSYGFKHL